MYEKAGYAGVFPISKPAISLPPEFAQP